VIEGRARRARPLWAATAGVMLVCGLSAALVPFRTDITLASPALVLVIPILVAGLAGGLVAAVVTAVAAALAFNVAFIPPYWGLAVHEVDDVVAFVVFLLTALAVGTLVAREGARRQSAEERALELQELNAELRALEEERARLAEEATRAAVLERVDEQRSALLRSVSHDLRTPLATIRAVTSDLQSDTLYDDATRGELLALVGDEAERLDRLVANLLSLSRIEAGALAPDLEAVALDELAGHAVERLGRRFEGRRVQLDLDADLPLVQGDYTQIELVLSNLLENAARHAPTGSIVRVGARPAGDVVEIWVDDEGPGVAPFEAERIFEPFRRGEGSSSSGVGLAICKAVVEAHGGVIAVDPSPGAGARFRYPLPRWHERGR
jgi:two-component system sensor histidine kinase KdpD